LVESLFWKHIIRIKSSSFTAYFLTRISGVFTDDGGNGGNRLGYFTENRRDKRRDSQRIFLTRISRIFTDGGGNRFGYFTENRGDKRRDSQRIF
jgi:hypothetical protein